MGSPRLFSVLLMVSTLLQSNLAALETNTVYHIKNVDDNTFLKVDSGGRACWNIGLVGTSSTLDATSISQRWLYNAGLPGSGYLEITDYNSDLALNELSMYSRDPWCYFAIREIKITPVSGNIYKLQDSNGGCLMSNGDGRRISWWPNCEGNGKLQWEFIKA
ncbi:hypothetical protein Ocin01_15751 [Orchesella cincta]|uniref:Ricin B lectin domain-containing protein n=1 Tax=Orchesella cincta TaxID=48709 RepID=A0A1D2MDA1_ORCCI|nr:hypothetical protein Ocin01_15751 [Orchesella cincta]